MTNLVYIDLYQKKPLISFGRPQTWRWTARSGDNQAVLAVSSEAYTNRGDAIKAIFLLFGADANAYLRESEHGNTVLRLAKDVQ